MVHIALVSVIVKMEQLATPLTDNADVLQASRAISAPIHVLQESLVYIVAKSASAGCIPAIRKQESASVHLEPMGNTVPCLAVRGSMGLGVHRCASATMEEAVMSSVDTVIARRVGWDQPVRRKMFRS